MEFCHQKYQTYQIFKKKQKTKKHIKNYVFFPQF